MVLSRFCLRCFCLHLKPDRVVITTLGNDPGQAKPVVAIDHAGGTTGCCRISGRESDGGVWKNVNTKIQGQDLVLN